MYLTYMCTKCGRTGILDIGDFSDEEIIKKLKDIKSFECKLGMHYEVDSPVYFWDINFDNVFGSETEAREFNKACSRANRD